MKIFLTLMLFCVSAVMTAQSFFNMPQTDNGGNGTRFVTCSGSFNDSGQQNNYSNNENGLATFCPGISTDRMRLDFLQVNILAGDVLTIYDGDTPAAPVLGTITNTTAPAGLFQASAGNSSGCLTVRFVSNATGVGGGWRALIECFNPCQTIIPTIVTTPATDADNILRICQGQQVTFNGTAAFGTDGTGATYEWNLGNGTAIVSGQTQTETYTNPGVYFVRFTVTDATGCFDRELIDLTIQVSTDPDFTGTRAQNNTICFGDTTTLTGVVAPQRFSLSPSPPIAGTTFLPDGSGVSYQTCIDVDLFAPGATVTNASDLLNIFVNMEHSYLGDLDISVTAPNGSTVALHNYPSGGSRFLGQPIDDDSDLRPGIGFDYVFTERPSATRTWAQYVTQVPGVTIPAGDYRPVDPFSTFVGSPLNGLWCININDNLFSDNGYIFRWGLNFNPAIIPPALSFIPGTTSRSWRPDPSIIATNGNVITVQPTTPGLNCYEYEFIDSFGCSYVEQVCVTVQPEITSAAPPDIVLCALPGSGTSTFDLTQDETITLNGLNPSLYTVQYHTSLASAQAGTNPIATPSSYTNTSSPETIYVSVRDNTTQCITTHSFSISTVDFGTIAIPDYEQCGAIVNFDLPSYVTPYLTSLGGSAGAGAFTISYYDSLLDAQASLNAIVNPASYTPSSNPVTIYVRIQSNADATCFAITPFSLSWFDNPIATQPANLVLCDETTTNALQASFNFDTQNASILNGQNPAIFNVSYHLSQTDADANSAPLNQNGYINIAPVQTIFARIENALAPQCFVTTSFTIEVTPLPVYNTVPDLVLCDDSTNDGIASFDLDSQIAAILGGQDPATLAVTFYESAADAGAGINPIVNSNAYNNTSNPQIIYVRVASTGGAGCFVTGSFELNVFQQPTANPTTIIELCDDASNDGVEVFDLSGAVTQVLGSQNPSDFNVTIHESVTDANVGANPLNLNYTNTSASQTLFARIENSANATCYDTTTIFLLLNEAPRIATPANLFLCDDVSGDGIEVFDLGANQSQLLNGLNAADYAVTYHLSQNDASTGIDPIARNYTNTASPQTIFVRVENNLTNCANTTSFTINVNPIPSVVQVAAIEECDDNIDGVATFILSERTNEILNGQTGASVEFFVNDADALLGINQLNANNYQNISNPQTISYRIINDATSCFAIGNFVIEAVAAPAVNVPSDIANCDNGTGSTFADLEASTLEIINGQTGLQVTYHTSQSNANTGSNALASPYRYSADATLTARVVDLSSGCVSFTNLNILYDELPQPTLQEEYIICRDPSGALINGPEILDTGLDNITYDFIWEFQDMIIPGATQAIYQATEPGDYTVTAININTGCENTTSTFVRQSGVPQIYDVQVTTDPFSFTHQIFATASGPDTYWFRLDDGPYVNSGRFENVSPGPHTVTIAERNGCGEIIVEVFVFGYPDYFTPNNDGYHDTWNIIGGDLLPGTTLYIFDRFGKLLKQLDPAGSGWDGTYNGQLLPSSDYWFKIIYVFEGRTAEATGHFAMKR